MSAASPDLCRFRKPGAGATHKGSPGRGYGNAGMRPERFQGHRTVGAGIRRPIPDRGCLPALNPGVRPKAEGQSPLVDALRRAFGSAALLFSGGSSLKHEAARVNASPFLDPSINRSFLLRGEKGGIGFLEPGQHGSCSAGRVQFEPGFDLRPDHLDGLLFGTAHGFPFFTGLSGSARLAHRLEVPFLPEGGQALEKGLYIWLASHTCLVWPQLYYFSQELLNPSHSLQEREWVKFLARFNQPGSHAFWEAAMCQQPIAGRHRWMIPLDDLGALALLRFQFEGRLGEIDKEPGR